MAEWVRLVGERVTLGPPLRRTVSVPAIALGNSKTQKGSLRGVKEKETQRKAGT